MNANVEKITVVPTEITINGITLLSIEEYEKYIENIPLLKNTWWLCSPGIDSDYAAYVYDDGSIDYDGIEVNFHLGVRPVLRISNLEIKDEFMFKNYKWTVISKELAICNKCIHHCAFREDLEAENANSYYASDVKKYIEDWLYN